MADKIALLLEAERRGILPDNKRALLAEARKRGLVPGGQEPSPPQGGMTREQRQAQIAALDAQHANSLSGTDRAMLAAEPFARPVVELGRAAAHNTMSLPHGIAQSIQHGFQGAVNAAIPAPQQNLSGLITGEAPEPEGLLQQFRQYVNDTVAQDDAALRQREAEYQAEVPDSIASYTGAAIGQIAPFIAGAPARLLQQAGAKVGGLLSKSPQVVQRVASGATQGGLLAAAQPVLEEDYAAGKAKQIAVGAGTGGAIPLATAPIRATANLLRPIVAPQKVADANLARLYGSDAATLAKLEQTPTFVPGERVTAAQALQTPRSVMVEKALRNRPDMREAFELQDIANNDARVGVLRKLAGTDDDLAAAVANRREKAGSFASERLQAGPESQRFTRAAQGLREFLDANPRMSSADFGLVNEARLIAGRVNRGSLPEEEAVKQIKALSPSSKRAQAAIGQALVAVNRNMVNPKPIVKTLENLSLSGNATVRSAAKEHLGLIRAHAGRNGGKVPAYALDDIRQNIGGMLAKHAPNGATGSQEAVKYAPVSTQITRTLDRSIPGYRDYLAAYRSDSVPINTMESVRSILGPLDTRGVNSGGASPLTLNALNTGLRKVDRQRYGLDPAARDALEGVRQSLRRASTSNSIRSPGSDTAYNLQADGWLTKGLLGEGFTGPSKPVLGLLSAAGGVSGSLLGGWIGAGIGAGLGAAVKAGADKVNQRVVSKVAAGAMDSQEAAKAIRRYLDQHPEDAGALLKLYPEWARIIGVQTAPPALIEP